MFVILIFKFSIFCKDIYNLIIIFDISTGTDDLVDL